MLDWTKIESSTIETLLKIILDNNLTLDIHIKSLCKMATQKLSPLFLNKQISLTYNQNLLFVNCIVAS